MTSLLATYEVRGRPWGASHGGVFLIDLEARSVRHMLEWAQAAEDLRDRERDLGLRGIALDGKRVYIASSDSLLCFDHDFRQLGEWKNAYLRRCQGVHVYERSLFIASSGFDAILGFDLDRQTFNWGLHVDVQGHRFRGQVFDPLGEEGPLMLGRLQINQIYANEAGMYISGAATEGMLHFNGRAIRMAAELPGGSHNAQPFRDGVLFNDCETGVLRYSGRGEGWEDRAIEVASAPGKARRAQAEADPDGLREGFARGLCLLTNSVVAVGSCPASVAVIDLAGNEQLLKVALSQDSRSAVHSLAVWSG